MRAAAPLAVAAAALGLAVLAGWLFHVPALVQLRRTWVPMQANTAVCLVVLAGAVATHRRWPDAAAALGGAAATLAAVTLVQYVSGLDFGIDEALFEHEITTLTSHPGRMAPNTATSFLCLGTALALPERHRPHAAALAACAIGFASVALAGYLTATPLAYGWGALTDMAAHTSVGVLLVGLGAMSVLDVQLRIHTTLLVGSAIAGLCVVAATPPGSRALVSLYALGSSVLLWTVAQMAPQHGVRR